MPTTTFEQDWTLDQVANWTKLDQDDDGTGGWDLEQTRTHNKSNAITGITHSEGDGWNAPTYDAAGNTTRCPSPAPGTASGGLTPNP